MSRDATLIQKRNERIKARYCELYDTQRLRKDDVLKLLVEEFCLAERTILQIIFGK